MRLLRCRDTFLSPYTSVLHVQSIWAEGDERAQKYKVHQYTSTIAFRLAGDHLLQVKDDLKPFEGTKPTSEILNFDGGME